MNLSKDLQLLSKVLPYITLDIVAFVMNLKINPRCRSRSTVLSSLQNPRPNLEGGRLENCPALEISFLGGWKLKSIVNLKTECSDTRACITAGCLEGARKRPVLAVLKTISLGSRNAQRGEVSPSERKLASRSQTGRTVEPSIRMSLCEGTLPRSGRHDKNNSAAVTSFTLRGWATELR